MKALGRVLDVRTEIRVVPEVARMFRTLAPYAPEEDRGGLANLERALGEDEAFRNRFLSSRVPGGSCEVLQSQVREAVADPRVEIAPILSFPNSVSPTDTPLYRAIEGAAADATRDSSSALDSSLSRRRSISAVISPR